MVWAFPPSELTSFQTYCCTSLHKNAKALKQNLASILISEPALRSCYCGHECLLQQVGICILHIVLRVSTKDIMRIFIILLNHSNQLSYLDPSMNLYLAPCGQEPFCLPFYLHGLSHRHLLKMTAHSTHSIYIQVFTVEAIRMNFK